MAKILIDARESGTSTGRYIDKLIEHIYKLQPEYDFTILTKSPRVDFFKKIAPRFKLVRSDYKEFTFSEQYGFVWQLYGIKNDLVHFGMIQQPVLYFGNSITTVHDLTTARFRNPAKNRLVFKLKQFIYKLVIKRVAKKSKAIIAPSEFVKNDLAEFANISKSKIFVTYEAADKIKDSAEALMGLNKNKFIMYVGRPLPHKNLDRLIDAFVVVQAKNPELKLVLAGKKDVLYQRLENQVRKRGIKNIVFTGFITDGKLRWLYENTAAYIFPSLSEGFGLPGLEAMAHGAPVVSSNATCLPEVYGNAAHYFDPLKTDDMADKITEVLNNKKLRDELVEAGFKQAGKYSWLDTAKKTLEVYSKILN